MSTPSCVHRIPIGRDEPFPETVQVFREGGDGRMTSYVPRVGPCAWRRVPQGGWVSGCGTRSEFRIGEWCPFCGGRMTGR